MRARAEIKKPTRGGDFGEITPPRKAAFFTQWASAEARLDAMAED